MGEERESKVRGNFNERERDEYQFIISLLPKEFSTHTCTHTQKHPCVRTSCKKRAVTSSSAYEESPPVNASHSPFRVRKYFSTKTRGRSGAYACTDTWVIKMGNKIISGFVDM
jgi:hypothetical protein